MVSYCDICGNRFAFTEENILKIKNVPENTFNFSDKTTNLNIIECHYCGAVQLYDVPLSKDFDVVYRSIGISLKHREQKKLQIKKFINTYNLYNKDLIEVGCGDGQILEIFKELEVNCYGVEKGFKNRKKCKDKGFNYVIEDIPTEITFDAFFTFHYLEHLINPTEFVSKLFRLLTPGGIGIIEVPNYDHIEEKNIWLEFTKDHRYYYRKRSLSLLLLKAGFEIETIEENDGGLCLTIIVRKPKYLDFISIKEKMNNDLNAFFNFINKTFNNDFSVYGAGHYSQLLLNSLFKETGIKPNRIFDSNLQKCGQRFLEIEIEYKDKILDCKDNIVVICGIYNKEVIEMLIRLGINEQQLFVWK